MPLVAGRPTLPEMVQEVLDTIMQIEGARRFGEVAVGTNYSIRQATKNILFDEKIGGTGYCVTYDTDSQSRNAPCVPFRGRGPRSGEGVDSGKNDYDT